MASDLVDRLRMISESPWYDYKSSVLRVYGKLPEFEMYRDFLLVAETIEDQERTIQELVIALTEVRDRFFPADQRERDRDLRWDLVNRALSKSISKE